MSIEAMTWALNLPMGNPTQKLILLSLANHASAEGYGAYPSNATVRRYAGISESTARRHLHALADAGLIAPGDQRAVEHHRPDKRPVVWDLVAMIQRGVNSTPGDAERGVTGAQSGVSPLTPEPSLGTSLRSVPNPSGASKRGTTAPDEFPISDAMRSWATENYPQVDLGHETEQFLDHHRAKGSVFKLWPAAWKKWIRTADKIARASKATAPSRQPYRNAVEWPDGVEAQA